MRLKSRHHHLTWQQYWGSKEISEAIDASETLGWLRQGAGLLDSSSLIATDMSSQVKILHEEQVSNRQSRYMITRVNKMQLLLGSPAGTSPSPQSYLANLKNAYFITQTDGTMSPVTSSGNLKVWGGLPAPGIRVY